MDISGSVIVVTGASRGIGREAAKALHAKGAKVGLLARSREDLEKLAAELGPRCVVAVADVADRDAVKAAIEKIAGELGPIDVLVNNAGLGSYGAVIDEEPDTYEHLMRVNYLGTVFPTLEVLPGMIARGRGHIVNVASVAGLVGAPFEAAYSASKFAVVGFTEALAGEVGQAEIGVSLINPGPVRTNFTDARGVDFQRKIPRPIKPERVAKAIVRATERDRFDQVMPRWLRIARLVRSTMPQTYRRSLRKSFAKEATELAKRGRESPRD